MLYTSYKFVLETANDIATELKLSLQPGSELKKEKVENFSIDVAICDVLRQIQQHILSLKIDLKTMPQVLAFQAAMTGVDFSATPMSVIKDRLNTALCDMESCRIKAADFNKIIKSYHASKSRFYASVPSQESLKAIKAMREAKTPTERSKVALSFIKIYPNNDLAEKIKETIPALRKIR